MIDPNLPDKHITPKEAAFVKQYSQNEALTRTIESLQDRIIAQEIIKDRELAKLDTTSSLYKDAETKYDTRIAKIQLLIANLQDRIDKDKA